MISITIIIIAITAIVSVIAFSNRAIMDKLLLSPYQIIHNKEFFRIITHALVHADYIHLAVNMIVLLSFGIAVENTFKELMHAGIVTNVTFHFLVLYIGGAVISTLSTIKKHKNDYYYQGVGASGAVSAIVFASIFFQPLSKLLIMGIIPIPAILFGVVYLAYSHYMSKKGNDNINHDAHFVGAVFGFIYPILVQPSLIKVFLHQLGLL
ncbi:MAG: rhomboid family intramembrane serine protease [Bacteroidales bacterium]|nr:rhomboid family intramembrane serine protease [Bacteroidales bacterium]MBN2748353.1 rhomboid family intramembrane serine protease [Bacteroidales bacterium]